MVGSAWSRVRVRYGQLQARAQPETGEFAEKATLTQEYSRAGHQNSREIESGSISGALGLPFAHRPLSRDRTLTQEPVQPILGGLVSLNVEKVVVGVGNRRLVVVVGGDGSCRF